MQRETIVKQMKVLYNKARRARKDGSAAAAKAFRAGGRRLQRKLRSIPVPAEKPAGEGGDEAAAEG